MKKVSIIGFGRFGKTLYRLLHKDFEIFIHDQNKDSYLNFTLCKNSSFSDDLEEVYSSEIIFIAIPIPQFEDYLKENQSNFKEDQLLIDVLSVKIHPKEVFERILHRKKTRVLLTHPMFGPDSSSNGFTGLPLVMDQFTATMEEYTYWKGFFEEKELRVVEMTADEHDRLAANSQGITHLLGRTLGEFGLEPTPIDTSGAKTLQQLMDVTLNDSWELFQGLQNYNPYTKEMRTRLRKSLDEVERKLLTQ
jgi:prephenate dehydrogenase